MWAVSFTCVAIGLALGFGIHARLLAVQVGELREENKQLRWSLRQTTLTVRRLQAARPTRNALRAAAARMSHAGDDN